MLPARMRPPRGCASGGGRSRVPDTPSTASGLCTEPRQLPLFRVQAVQRLHHRLHHADLIVGLYDRLARRQQDGINLLEDWCARNVRVVVVTQQIALNGAVGRMVASVLFGLAEIEWEYRRERQAAGIAVAKARGVYRGRRKGTTKAKPHRARALRQTGLTVRGSRRNQRHPKLGMKAIISSTGSSKVLCVSLDTAMVLRVITPHDREGLEASPHANHK